MTGERSSSLIIWAKPQSACLGIIIDEAIVMKSYNEFQTMACRWYCFKELQWPVFTCPHDHSLIGLEQLIISQICKRGFNWDLISISVGIIYIYNIYNIIYNIYVETMSRTRSLSGLLPISSRIWCHWIRVQPISQLKKEKRDFAGCRVQTTSLFIVRIKL